MIERDDHELLARYAREGSEQAFAALVARHVNLVYSTARRVIGNPHCAEEIAQAVFIILARKAGSLRRRTVISGWLYQTTRFTAANFIKGEMRRQLREQEVYMQSTLNEPDAAVWERIIPLLDEAMGRLGETERNAVVLHFFEKKTLQEVGTTLNLTEAAAQKRVARALEKLRRSFSKRGLTLSAAAIAVTVSANSVQAAPGGVGASVAAGSLGKAAAVASVQWAVKATLQKFLWFKIRTALLTALGLSLVGGGIAISRQKRAPAFSSMIYRVPVSGATAPRATAGVSPIKIKLLGTPGLAYEMTYSADGQPQTAKGVLPDEVSFNADAFSATIIARGPGEFGFEAYRGDLQQASAEAIRIPDVRRFAIEGRKGGGGISVSGKPN